jgi:hypothetical protein
MEDVRILRSLLFFAHHVTFYYRFSTERHIRAAIGYSLESFRVGSDGDIPVELIKSPRRSKIIITVYTICNLFREF